MPTLLEESRPSTLTFAGRRESAQSTPPFDQLQRVREPVSRSKVGVQGKVADVVHGRSRHAESQNELRAFQILMATARANSWQEQPFTLKYHHEGKKHRYTPDILVKWGARQEVVEIKEDQDAELAENRERFALIGHLLAAHGYIFRIWRKSEICAQPRLANSNFILRYRCVNAPATDWERVRRVLSSALQPSLQMLCHISGVPVQNILRFVLDGTLNIDWWAPLGLDSEISPTPIGRQVWPYVTSECLQDPPEEARCR